MGDIFNLKIVRNKSNGQPSTCLSRKKLPKKFLKELDKYGKGSLKMRIVK